MLRVDSPHWLNTKLRVRFGWCDAIVSEFRSTLDTGHPNFCFEIAEIDCNRCRAVIKNRPSITKHRGATNTN